MSQCFFSSVLSDDFKCFKSIINCLCKGVFFLIYCNFTLWVHIYVEICWILFILYYFFITICCHHAKQFRDQFLFSYESYTEALEGSARVWLWEMSTKRFLHHYLLGIIIKCSPKRHTNEKWGISGLYLLPVNSAALHMLWIRTKIQKKPQGHF